jgi:hypothetical protein
MEEEPSGQSEATYMIMVRLTLGSSWAHVWKRNLSWEGHGKLWVVGVPRSSGRLTSEVRDFCRW